MSSPPEPPPEFEVIHPKEPEDEPLLENYQSWPFGFWKKRYTRTGRLWLNAPWLFMIRKRLRCSLLELLIFVLAVGSSLGTIIGALTQHRAAVGLIVCLVPVVLYGHLWWFSAALYRQRLDPKNANSVPNGAYVALYLILPTLICHGAGLFLRFQ